MVFRAPELVASDTQAVLEKVCSISVISGMFRDAHAELNLVGIQQPSDKGHDRKMGGA